MAESHLSEELERATRLIITYVRLERDRYQSAVNHVFIACVIAGISFAAVWIHTVQHLVQSYSALGLAAAQNRDVDAVLFLLVVMAIGAAAAGVYILGSVYEKFYDKITETHLTIIRTILDENFAGQEPSDLGEGIR